MNILNIFKKKPVKFCVDCKYYSEYINSDGSLESAFSKCNREIPVKRTKHYLVDRDVGISKETLYCSTERRLGKCGESAKYFEAKE